MVYLVPIGSQKKCCVQDVDWSNPTDKASDLKRFLARRYVDCGPSLDVTSADDSYQITMFGRCYRILINDDYNTLCVDSCRLVRQALLIHHFAVESRNFGMFFDYEFSSKSKGYLILDKIGHDLVNKKIKFSLDDDMKDEEISDALHQLARHFLEYCLPDEILSYLQGGVEYSVKLLGNDCPDADIEISLVNRNEIKIAPVNVDADINLTPLVSFLMKQFKRCGVTVQSDEEEQPFILLTYL